MAISKLYDGYASEEDRQAERSRYGAQDAEGWRRRKLRDQLALLAGTPAPGIERLPDDPAQVAGIEGGKAAATVGLTPAAVQMAEEARAHGIRTSGDLR